MKLITELTEDVQVIEEAAADGKKSLYIEGIYLQGGIPNRNKRIYPVQTLAREVNRYVENYVQKGRAYGELGHPTGPQINLERVSHLIKSIRQDGGNFIGKAKITDTPYGNIARGLIGEGARLGVSSRGMGSLKPGKDGIMEVQDDFHLATAADIVADPSAPDAFVNGIMEGKEWVWEGGAFKEVDLEHARMFIKRQSSRELEEAKLRVWKKLISSF